MVVGGIGDVVNPRVPEKVSVGWVPVRVPELEWDIVAVLVGVPIVTVFVSVPLIVGVSEKVFVEESDIVAVGDVVVEADSEAVAVAESVEEADSVAVIESD